MHNIKLILLISFVITQTTLAQKPVVNEFAAIDKKALSIPDTLTQTTNELASYINSAFRTDKEKSRAIFIWVASSIQYDLENMYAINFYEKKEDLISGPLKTRKGICANYAELFNDLCAKSGIKSFVISGYTKQNGFADYLPHAWCAALIESTWLLFDPTWGSGHVTNGKFVKKINNYYFAAKPSTLIKSHMPFDPLWQFLNSPVTNQEFYESKTQPNSSKAIFNYQDSIKAYEQQSHIAQLEATARRIEQNGLKNSMIFDRLQHIKLEIEQDRRQAIVTLHNNNINVYNAAIANYNTGINRLNEFIQYRNKQFNPSKTDAAIQQMVDSAAAPLKEATTKLTSIKDDDSSTITLIAQLHKSINDAALQVQEQQNWLTLYFAKGKSGRKSMFKTYSWFGIPLN